MRVPPATLSRPRGAGSRRSGAAIAPGAWLGLLGGGQLGRMFCMAAQSLGYRSPCSTRAPTARPAASPTGTSAPTTSTRAASRELAALAAAATTEFENVPAAALEFLARTARVSPGGRQRRDRAGPHQREDVPRRPRLRRRAVRGAAQRRPTRARVDRGAAARASSRARGWATTARARSACAPRADVARRVRARWAASPCVLEQLRRPRLRGVGDRRPRRARRRSRPGRSPRTGIATASSTSRSSRRASPTALADAGARASRLAVADALDYRGVLCVEMFVTARRRAARQRDRAAPAQQRPLHDRRLRHLAVRAAGARARRPAAGRHAAARAGGDGEPAGRPLVRRPRRDGAARARLDARAAHPQAKLHLYGKAEPRRGRKMGHVTCLAPTLRRGARRRARDQARPRHPGRRRDL